MSDDEQSSEARALTFEQLRNQWPNVHGPKARKFFRLDESRPSRCVLGLDGIDANDLGPGAWEDRYAFVAEDREFLKIAEEIRQKLAPPEPTMEDRILAELKEIRKLLEDQKRS